MDSYFIAIETLAFLYEILKSHDLGHVRSHVIRMSKLPKIAKINSIWLAILHYSLSLILKTLRNFYYYIIKTIN